MYDYLIVGAGLFGSVFAHEMTIAGRSCRVIDRRSHIGGNCYTEKHGDIVIHKYGAHIFRTNSKKVWEYVNRFAEFNRFTNCPIAISNNELYNLPFNMNTFHALWGVKTPAEAVAMIESQKVPNSNPQNLEENVLSMIGRDVYEKLVKGYTEKQWGAPCSQLPPDLISRIPIRLTFDNNYFYERFQGVPIGGYHSIFQSLLTGAMVELRRSFSADDEQLVSSANKIVYCGRLDELYGFKYGRLPYRSLRFEEETVDVENLQGNAVVNYIDADVPYTRVIEHKHFQETPRIPYTVITREYPADIEDGKYPFYPVKNKASMELYKRYKAMAIADGYIVGGNVAEYEDYTMDETIQSALKAVEKELSQ